MPKSKAVKKVNFPDIGKRDGEAEELTPHFHNGTDSPYIDQKNAEKLGVLSKYCVALTMGTQELSNATWTALNFATEVFDPTDNHSSTSNTSRIRPSKGGIWEVHGYIDWEANTTGNRGLALYKNGISIKEYWFRPDGSGNCSNVMTWVLNLTTADYIELYAYQNSTAALDVETGVFTAKLLGFV